MLSTELKQGKDENHLQNILNRIKAPKAPEPYTSEGRKFRKSVVERIEVQRILSSSLSEASSLATEDRSICTCFRCHHPDKKTGSEPEFVWRRIECRTLETFDTITTTAISNSLHCIRCLKSIHQSLSFWEDPHPEWEGLSIIGCYMWGLSFAIQHLIDDENPKGEAPGMDDIRQQYKEIAQAGEIFCDMVEKFHEHTRRLRSDAVYTVKKLTKKWQIENKTPLTNRPEKVLYKIPEPKRRIGKGLSDFQSEHDLFKETALHLNWTPLTLVVRSKNIGWKEFSQLVLKEKIHLFCMFAQKVIDILELAAEEMQLVTGRISSIEVDIHGSSGSKSHARELSGAMAYFAKNCTPPKSPTGKERDMMIKLLSEHWYAVDIMHEEAHKLLRLIHETRDIIRTCYVYSDVFYKWNLPNYDHYLVNGLAPRRRHEGSQTLDNIRASFNKFISKDKADKEQGGGENRLSDISEMLVMMDFSTSAYQRILEVRPVEAEGMLMKVEFLHKLPESSGLISGADIRKSGAGIENANPKDSKISKR